MREVNKPGNAAPSAMPQVNTSKHKQHQTQETPKVEEEKQAREELDMSKTAPAFTGYIMANQNADNHANDMKRLADNPKLAEKSLKLSEFLEANGVDPKKALDIANNFYNEFA